MHNITSTIELPAKATRCPLCRSQFPGTHRASCPTLRPPIDRAGYSAGVRDLIDTAERRGATDDEIRRLIDQYQASAIQRVTEGGER